MTAEVWPSRRSTRPPPDRDHGFPPRSGAGGGGIGGAEGRGTRPECGFAPVPRAVPTPRGCGNPPLYGIAAPGDRGAALDRSFALAFFWRVHRPAHTC